MLMLLIIIVVVHINIIIIDSLVLVKKRFHLHDKASFSVSVRGTREELTYVIVNIIMSSPCSRDQKSLKLFSDCRIFFSRFLQIL